MDPWKRRDEVTGDHDTSRKPSALFWREDGINKPRIETTRKKKDTSGGTIKKVQTSTEGSKENRAPTVNKHQRRPSLKDLCPEDKQRVKQLIEQLARTSTEKEAMEDRMREERRQFTLLLDKLKKQHHKVVKEKKELETELHASQLQLQAIHTYPSSSSNNTPQLTHLHMGSAVAATTTANPLQTAAVQRRPGVPTTNTISSRNLPMVSQPSVTRTSLSQLPTVGACSNTLPLPRCDTESMSSRVTCTEVPSIHASYPAYFTASSRNPNHTNVNFGNDHTQRGSSTTTVYPSLSPMDSLSTTSISHGQGVPLSSTHVQHYSQQEECLAGNRHPHIKIDSPSSSDATSGPLQHGDKCYGREVPTIEHHVTHNATCTGPEKQQHQAGVSQSELEVPISTSTTCRTEPTTPPLPVRQHWLSLPSATPEQRSSPCDRKMKREGNLLQKKADSGVGGSCREIGTQTLYVESVSTQTDLDGEKRDQPPTSSAIIGQMNVSSSSPTLTKGSVDSTAMSVGDLHAIAPSDSPQPNTKLSITERTPRPRPDQGINGSHSAPQDFNQLNSEDTLMEELLTASFLLNSQGALAVGSQAGSHGSSSTSKEAELLRLESISPFELAAALNSHRDLSRAPSPKPSFSLTFQQHHLPHKNPNPPFSFCQHEHSPPSETRLSTTSPENSPPRYTNYYRDWDRDTTYTRQGCSLDDSKLIEELFFI